MRDSSDLLDERLAEPFRLAGADAVDAAQLLDVPRLQPRELAQRGVVKNDVRRHAAGTRETQPHRAQTVEQILIGVGPLARGRTAAFGTPLSDDTALTRQ